MVWQALPEQLTALGQSLFGYSLPLTLFYCIGLLSVQGNAEIRLRLGLERIASPPSRADWPAEQEFAPGPAG